jgi:SAM-dependent methyltransferase
MSISPADGARSLLACPLCKSGLALAPGLFRCVSCGEPFPQGRDDCIDLFPERVWNDRTRWEERQREMEESYRELMADPAEAILGYRSDYGPYGPLLSRYDGLVLDVGGGNGVARHYLPAEARYVVLEPSLEWLAPEWSGIAHAFPCLSQRPCFIRGTGEYLPFGAGFFDGVLSFWSLNHVSRPAAVIEEIHRVLRPGGRVLVVLEEMPPRWRELADGTFPAPDLHARMRMVLQKLWAPLGGWPVQSDHVRIGEEDFLEWASGGFEVLERAWIGAYLAFELRKTGT